MGRTASALLCTLLLLGTLPSLADEPPFDPTIALSEAARSVDIVGVHLGMTPEEVDAVLKEQDPEASTRILTSHFKLSNGETTERPHIFKMSSAKLGHIWVRFTEFPREPVAASGERRKKQQANQPAPIL